MSLELNAILDIERLGARGEGVARHEGRLVFAPYALAGERIRAEVDGERARLVDVLEASPDRAAAECPLFTACGGCAVQTLARDPYLEWKRGLVLDALRNAGVAVEPEIVEPALDAHGAGRRRATLHARYDRRGRAHVGFMAARAHDLVEFDHCPLLVEALSGAPNIARSLAEELASLGKPLDVALTATRTGLDVDLRGAGKLDFALTQNLMAAAAELDLARLSNHGLLVVERRQPLLQVGAAILAPPAGAFLQATETGEAALADFVARGMEGAARVADLFAGVGTFALRLARGAEVYAAEWDEAALAALDKARRTAPLRPVRGERRDLFRRPVLRGELKAFDAVVFDPPRAGAQEQAREIAASDCPVAAAVSCNPLTFARDAKILIEGGYRLERVQPVDQFRYSAHVEIAALFRKPARAKARRGLLSR